jgi:transposase
MQAVLKAQINKTDRNDARGIAQMMRVGLYRPVHVKTLRSQKLRMLLTHRKLLQSKAIAIDNDLRGTLRNFGLKVGMVGTVKFEARIKELVENLPDLAVLIEPLLVVRRALREQFAASPLAGHRAGRRSVPAPDDDPGCRPRGGADLSRHGRRAGSVPQIQVRRGGIWTDVLQVSIR